GRRDDFPALARVLGGAISRRAPPLGLHGGAGRARRSDLQVVVGTMGGSRSSPAPPGGRRLFTFGGGPPLDGVGERLVAAATDSADRSNRKGHSQQPAGRDDLRLGSGGRAGQGIRLSPGDGQRRGSLGRALGRGAGGRWAEGGEGVSPCCNSRSRIGRDAAV